MDADEVSAVAVVIQRNNTSHIRGVTPHDHFRTVVLLATDAADGRIALGETNISNSASTSRATCATAVPVTRKTGHVRRTGWC